MSFSLYDVTVPQFRQILAATRAQLDKAEAFCASKSLPHGDIIHARLFEDMLPFSYQIKSTVTHSTGALDALAKGVFSPDMSPPPDSFAALKEKVDGALKALDAYKPADINGYVGRDMRFELREFKLDFT